MNTFWKMKTDNLGVAESIILGAIQGLTEFLPISSSGHLALSKHILGTNIQNPLGFDIALHIGTTFSVIFVLWSDIVSRIRSRENLLGVLVAFACTVPIALLLKNFAELVEVETIYLSVSFLAGGLILILFPKFKFEFGFWKYVFIGVMQGVSAIPGISRSGTTISSSMFSGMNPQDAFGFSFFLSIPTILSAIAYESFEIFVKGETFGESVGLVEIVSGIVSSFVFGCVSLLILRKIVIAKKLWVFGVYMLFVSVFTFLYSVY